MGTQLSALFSGVSRFFEYPVKRKPICFYRQEDFTATGRYYGENSAICLTT